MSFSLTTSHMLSKWINGRSLNINLTTPPFLPGRDVLVGHFDSKQVCDVFCGIISALCSIYIQADTFCGAFSMSCYILVLMLNVTVSGMIK